MFPEYFSDLPPDEQRRTRSAMRMSTELGFRYACPFIIGPAHDRNARVNSGSGVIVSRGKRYFFVTADHVIAGFELRASNEFDLNAHLTASDGPSPFDPRARVVYRDAAADIAVLTLERDEVQPANTIVYDRLPTAPQSMVPPQEGEFVIVAGYPGVLRAETGPREMRFDSYVVGTTISGVFHDRMNSKFQREHWIGDREDAPGIDLRDLGGMSGGPVFRTSGLAFELLGVVSQYDADLDYLSCARLDTVPVTLWARSN